MTHTFAFYVEQAFGSVPDCLTGHISKDDYEVTFADFSMLYSPIRPVIARYLIRNNVRVLEHNLCKFRADPLVALATALTHGGQDAVELSNRFGLEATQAWHAAWKLLGHDNSHAIQFCEDYRSSRG